jgi:hypothetical protein
MLSFRCRTHFGVLACGGIPEEVAVFRAACKAHFTRSFYEFSKQSYGSKFSLFPPSCADQSGRRALAAAMPPVLSLTFSFLRNVNWCRPMFLARADMVEGAGLPADFSQRRAAKKDWISAADSPARMPEVTSTRWFSPGASSTRRHVRMAPPRGSSAP